MKISFFKFCFFFFFFVFGIEATRSSFSKLRSPDKFFGFFIVGDSYVDPGNNNYVITNVNFRANFSPYGETFFHDATGRFSDGRLITDFLAEYAEIPLIQPYLDPKNNNYMNGVNFASSGGGALAETHQNQVIALPTQMNFFKKVLKSLRMKLGIEKSQIFLSNSVFLFNFGGNDYLSPFDFSYDIFKTLEGRQQYVNMVVGNITIAVQEVYKNGGRKFGFMTVPPLGYMPSSRLRSDKFFQESSSLTMLHNKFLHNAIQNLSTQLHGFKYAFADTHTLLLQRIQNPTKYGFKVADTACCGSGKFRGILSCGRRNQGSALFTHCKNVKDYVFYDAYHPTEKTFEQLAKVIWSGGVEIVEPYNFKQLFRYDSTLAFD